jgi:hypothetical protein
MAQDRHCDGQTAFQKRPVLGSESMKPAPPYQLPDRFQTSATSTGSQKYGPSTDLARTGAELHWNANTLAEMHGIIAVAAREE